MLLLRRERFFARVGAGSDGGGTVLTVASLTRGSGETGPRFAALTEQLRGRARRPRRPTSDTGGAHP